MCVRARARASRSSRVLIMMMIITISSPSSGNIIIKMVITELSFSDTGGRKITFLPPELCHPSSSGLMKAQAENVTVKPQRVSGSNPS